MFKFILPIILIALAVTGFFLFTKPLYRELSLLRGQTASYNEALHNSKQLENERDKLTQKYNSLDPQNLDKLQKLLPDSIDNIRLILEIEKIALPYGMGLQDVQYDAVKKDNPANPQTVQGGGTLPITISPDYGIWELAFSTQGIYSNFVNFLKDLERNLRIVDVESVQFSSDTGSGATPDLTEVYKYSVKIKTYWLKN